MSANENERPECCNDIPCGTVKRCVRHIELETMEMVDAMDSLTMADASKNSNVIGDGNDSGIDTGATPMSVGTLQRALSSNSAGYASSSGGGDVTVFASCNSSLLSVCSELFDGKTIVGGPKPINDCTSEGGSESSSLSNGPTASKRHASPKKRVAMIDPSTSPTSKSPKKTENPVARIRTRAASANRAAAHRSSMMAPSGAPTLATTERARSREKQNSSANSNGTNVSLMTRSASMRRPIKPDSLPTNLRDMASSSVQRVTALSRTPSITRRTPSNCTPSTEDGRWPSIGAKNSRNFVRNGSSTPDNLVIKTKIGPIILENKSSSADKCATLPRRRKEKSEENLRQLGRSNRSNSMTRDQRMTSSAIGRRSSKESTPQKPQSHPPRGRKLATAKTIIYHETAVQTALTSSDIDGAFAGIAKEIHVDAVTTSNKDSQVDMRDNEIERLEGRLRQLTGENVKLQHDLDKRTVSLNDLEQQLARERDEKSAMKNELMSNTERVLSMLQMVNAPTHAVAAASGDSLLMLESQIQLSEHALEEKQTEINTLRSFCNELQAEMSRSVHVQQTMLEERKCLEKESNELQDFLQDEKTAIVEALKEAEAEIEQHRVQLKTREQDVERLQDECRHLVRISEQRRQEYLGMQSKYTALESKSKDMIVQQNNAVSGATIALSDLGSRLNSLVEQLVASYSISEREIEDVIYHNEAYANSSDESSPECERVADKTVAGRDDSLSPQRNQSFIAAVINAIKSAANTAKQSVHKKSIGEHTPTFGDDLESDSTEMLDSETEPCLMMENVLEDVSMPDSHSHNMVSSTNSQLMVTGPTNDMNKDEESLHNLCEAIANRKKIEQQANLMMMQHRGIDCEPSNSDDVISDGRESIADIPSISENWTVQHLVDHVINVDNLVTKLLKVLRLIQIENDNCVQRLISEKNKLQLNKEDLLEKMKDWEHMNMKLRSDLGIASEQLLINCDELANSKMELQRRRKEINKLNEDICRLSTLCAQNQTSVTQSLPQDVILNAFKNWQENKETSDLDLYLRANEGNVTSMDNENQSSVISSNTLNCQNEAITKAIETLNGIQSIVAQCPALADLQRDLELMLPADCNANNTSTDQQSISTDSAINQSIDLSA